MDMSGGRLPKLTLPPPSLLTSSQDLVQRSAPTKKRKGASFEHVVTPAGKRTKRMGRPKNGWTATRKRKLIRLYLMTELDVAEISQVLRAENFQPCKRDIQKQLTLLLQNRPNQVRARGPITKTRLRLLRECKDLRSLEKKGAVKPSSKSPASSNESETPTPQSDDQRIKFPLSTDQIVDWSWLDFDSEYLPATTPVNNSPGCGASVPGLTSPASISTGIQSEACTESPRDTPRIEIVSSNSNRSTSVIYEDDTPKEQTPSDSKGDLKTHQVYKTNDNGSIHTAASSSRSIISLRSLKKRLQSKYSGSFIHDIKSLMDRLTISEASEVSSIETTKHAYHSKRSIPSNLGPAVILPGFFPQYCWEHLNTNELRRCDDLPLPCSQGPIFSPLGLETHRAMRSDVMFRIRSSSVRKDDLHCTDAFGNSVLHVAASLGARPSYLSRLITMGADIHRLNIAGQTFLHLIYLSDIPHIAEFRFLVGTLVQRGFNFLQRDDNGQTVFHVLIQSCMPNEIIDDAIQCLGYHGIGMPNGRDNLGFDVSCWSRKPTFDMLPPPAEDEDNIYRTFSMTTDEASVGYENPSQSYIQLPRGPVSPWIENLEDLQNYELHADLLRTILRATDEPSFEDTSGRNGLHCLAAVRLDLPVSSADYDETPQPKSRSPSKSRSKSPHIETTLREQYLDQLILSGVDPNSYDRQGSTPFVAFVANTREEEDDNLTSKLLDRLCRAGADINRRNRQGETPLHVAVKLGKRAATKFLIARGANVHARTGDGTGALSLGLRYSDRASQDDVLYAQISLCISLLAGAGAVSAPTILREWASEEFRIAPDKFPSIAPRQWDGGAPVINSTSPSMKGLLGVDNHGNGRR